MMPLLRVAEASKSLGISERSMRRLVARKAIAYHDIPNGGVRFLESDLDAFAKSHRREVVVQAIRSGVYDFSIENAIRTVKARRAQRSNQ